MKSARSFCPVELGRGLDSQPVSSSNRSFWVFMRRHYQINELIGHRWWIQPPALLPSRKSGGGTDRSNPLFMVGSPGNRPPSFPALQKSPHSHGRSCGDKGLVVNHKMPKHFQERRTRDQRSGRKMLPPFLSLRVLGSREPGTGGEDQVCLRNICIWSSE